MATLFMSCFITGCISGSESSEESSSATLQSTNKLIVDKLDASLKELSLSVSALGDEYLKLYEKTSPMAKAERNKWLANSKHGKDTIIFYPSTGTPVAYQAPQPSFLYYSKEKPTETVWRELKIFETLAAPFKASSITFNDSWVYMTTVNNAFLIYPHLPLKQAVNNYPPTKQIFYTAADFKNKTIGWTEPYLDLVGAGMMVTAAYPVYDKDKLLGVISRDITLDQISRQALRPVSGPGAKAYCIIMDKNGLAVANREKSAMEEIDKVNNKAGAAILYYRKTKDLKPKFRNSKNDLYNRVGSAVIDRIKQNPTGKIWNFTISSLKQPVVISAAQVKNTGWIVASFIIQGTF